MGGLLTTTVLHLGCGRKSAERFDQPADARFITLDAEPLNEPDLVCTLGRDKIDLPDDSVDVAFAIHVLEHIGKQGETDAWFFFWEDLYRVLKPGAQLRFESPLWSSVWCWADPQHCRALSPPAFIYFDQDNYKRLNSAITPYRIRCDFEVVGQFVGIPDGNPLIASQEPMSHFQGTLQARKPLHPWWEETCS